MDNYENMFKTICRLCLSQCKSGKMVSLIDNSSDDGLSCFGKAITTVTNVLLQKGDNLPTVMCEKCVYLLKQSIYFKLKCESSEKQLKRLVNQDVNNGVSSYNIKEIICQYVIFNQYFSSENNLTPSRKHFTSKKDTNKSNFCHKSDQKPSTDKVGSNIDLADKTYDFDDLMDHEDNINNSNDKREEYSNEINNILDTIQGMINTELHILPTRTKRKIKKEQRYRSAIPVNELTYKSSSNTKLKREQYRRIIPTNERNLLCKICHKILANRWTYDHHMQRHSVCRFMCDQCGKGFPVLTEMQMHQIAQHGIGPYLQCDHCPYKAPRKLNLIEHMRIHTGERPFTCEKCGLTFRRKAIWRNHLVCHMEKKVQCTYCPRKFFRHSSMLAHCNNVHERQYMYMCSICSITYTKTETVKRHMLVKHGIPREKQGRIMRIANGSGDFPGKVI